MKKLLIFLSSLLFFAGFSRGQEQNSATSFEESVSFFDDRCYPANDYVFGTTLSVGDDTVCFSSDFPDSVLLRYDRGSNLEYFMVFYLNGSNYEHAYCFQGVSNFSLFDYYSFEGSPYGVKYWIIPSGAPSLCSDETSLSIIKGGETEIYTGIKNVAISIPDGVDYTVIPYGNSYGVNLSSSIVCETCPDPTEPPTCPTPPICTGSGDIAEQFQILNSRMEIQTLTPARRNIFYDDVTIQQKSDIILPAGLIAYNSGDATLIDFASGNELPKLQPLTGEILNKVEELGGSVIYVILTIVGFILLALVLVRAFTSFKHTE